MRDYFASIATARVTGVTAGDTPLNSRELANDKTALIGTPSRITSGDKGDAINTLSPIVTLPNPLRVTQEIRETAALPPAPFDTPDYEALHCCYHERAGIYQFDAGYPQEEAERLAYQDALIAFLSRYHPVILAEFESTIFKQTIN